MKENAMTMNFESHECVIFAQSMEIGTHENKAIHSIFCRRHMHSLKCCHSGYVKVAKHGKEKSGQLKCDRLTYRQTNSEETKNPLERWKRQIKDEIVKLNELFIGS